MNNPKYHWFFKYKLYHLPFWFLYHWMWWTLVIGNPWVAINTMFFSPFALKFVFYFIFEAAGVYFNLYFLIPRFLEKGKFISYVLLVMLTIVCTAILIVPGYYASALLSGSTVKEVYHADYLLLFKNNTLSSAVASMTLAMSVKLTKNWIQTRRREQVLEKEKLETELKFLKSQINPHFLFNTINSIFVLIHKNPDMASASLAKFSDLLRYQLYECNEHQIPLSQEISYLHNYVELEKLRQEQTIKLDLKIELPLSGDFMIAPFIVMPFIENAFKHVSRGRGQQNQISIHLHTSQDQLCLEVVNSISKEDTAHAIQEHKGIGLKNVQRRLDLLYPGKHELIINRQHNEFQVSLRLHLHKYHSTDFSTFHKETNLVPVQIPV